MPPFASGAPAVHQHPPCCATQVAQLVNQHCSCRAHLGDGNTPGEGPEDRPPSPSPLTCERALVHPLQDRRHSEEGKGHVEVPVLDGREAHAVAVQQDVFLRRGEAQQAQIEVTQACMRGKQSSFLQAALLHGQAPGGVLFFVDGRGL